MTGGASGIGLAVVRRLLDRGETVTILDIDADAVDRTDTELSGTAGGRLAAVVVDVTEADAPSRAFADAARNSGAPDRLVTCAGIRGELNLALQTDVKEWRHLMDVHLFGTWAACQAFATELLGPEPGGAHIDAAVVTISSMGNHSPPRRDAG